MYKVLAFLLVSINLHGQVCFVTEEHAFNWRPQESGVQYTLNDHCISIYVETDYYTFSQFGSVAAVKAWIDQIEQNAKIIYQNEDINIDFVEPYIPTEPGGWSEQYVSTVGILQAFGLERKNSPGHLKHFVTMRPLGGGVAWINMLCQQSGPGITWGPFAVSGSMTKVFPNYPTYSWNVMVFTHEMGHNLGSSHTQNCVWGPNSNERIDDCAGGDCTIIQPIERSTIMSYCHTTNYGINLQLGFGTLPGELIRSRVASSGCLEVSGVLNLTGNLSGNYFRNTINVNNATGANFNLYANEITLINSEAAPQFNAFLLGCQN